jgi:hypothetical protein
LFLNSRQRTLSTVTHTSRKNFAGLIDNLLLYKRGCSKSIASKPEGLAEAESEENLETITGRREQHDFDPL